MGEREDDDGLMARVAAGDEKAFRTLVDRHADRVFALARRVLRNEADAQDIAQDIFTRLWTRADSYRPGRARFTTWLYRVVINACLNQRRRPGNAVSSELGEDPPDPAAGPDGLAVAGQMRDRLSRAIDRLPEGQRTAIALTLNRELSNREAAAAMSISVKALEALLVRARRTLRAALADETSGG